MLLERRVFFLFSHVRGSTSSSSLRPSLRRTRLRDYFLRSHTWGARDGTAFCDSATIAYQSASPGRLTIRPKVYRTAASRVVSLSQTLVLELEPKTWWGHAGTMPEPWRGFLVSFAGLGGRKRLHREQICLLCAVRSRRGSQRTGGPTPSSCPPVAHSPVLAAGSSPQLFANPWAAQDLQPSSCCCSRTPARRSA